MADEQQIAPMDPTSRQTMREALVDYLENRRQEEIAQQREERHREREERATLRRKERTARVRAAKAKRLMAANEAHDRMVTHVGAAVRSLQAAVRAATEIRFPRHSPEGRAQAETVRGLEDAIGSLRRTPRGGRHDVQNFDVDLDVDET